MDGAFSVPFHWEKSMQKIFAAASIAVVLGCVVAFAADNGDEKQQPEAAVPSECGTVLLHFPAEFRTQPAQLRTARLLVDDKFVGHAIVNLHGMPSKFRLAPGDHEFRVELAGYEPFSSTIYVIGNDTDQYLVVDAKPEE